MFFNGRRLKVACFDDRVLPETKMKETSPILSYPTLLRHEQTRIKKNEEEEKHAAAVNVDLADGPLKRRLDFLLVVVSSHADDVACIQVVFPNESVAAQRKKE